jgi:serine phosphatase RsbU (regulator of sigma subunit)
LIFALKAQINNSDITDGMDISLVAIKHSGSLEFSGANNPLYLVQKGELMVYEADPMPVGKNDKDNRPFTCQKIAIENDDRIFLFTDGYKDQFGGERDKKFSSKQFREIVAETSSQSIDKQLSAISNTFNVWKGENEQVDDVLVMGIKL